MIADMGKRRRCAWVPSSQICRGSRRATTQSVGGWEPEPVTAATHLTHKAGAMIELRNNQASLLDIAAVQDSEDENASLAGEEGQEKLCIHNTMDL